MTDEAWMRRAIALAERARGTTEPNPAVGCVIVSDGVVVGEGWTRPPGGPHAEIVALSAAGEEARGAVAYVTLEPCNHHGRTGPCSRALVDAGVERVVVAAHDPSPWAGGGADALRAAGVHVEVGLLGEEARRQNEAFFAAAERGSVPRPTLSPESSPESLRPVVTVKLAVSLDGRIAAADGTSQWLTGKEARRSAHDLRSDVDAIVVGSGTVLADDPRLTVRLGRPVALPPLRVVLDGRARTRPDARVYDAAAPSVAVVDPSADAGHLTRAGVEVWRIGGERKTGESLRMTLDRLADRGVRRALVEGGAQVAGAFLAADLTDRLVVHVAPVLLGSEGRPALELNVPTLGVAPRWRLEHVEQVGSDAVLTCSPEEV